MLEPMLRMTGYRCDRANAATHHLFLPDLRRHMSDLNIPITHLSLPQRLNLALAASSCSYHFLVLSVAELPSRTRYAGLPTLRTGTVRANGRVMRELALNCINGFLLSVVLILLMEKIASRVGLVDIPTPRKKHDGNVPMVGVAVFVAFAVSAILLQERPDGFLSFMIGLTGLVILGLLDDRMNLRAIIKFIAQIGCVALMVLPSKMVIWHVGALLGSDHLLLMQWAAPVTIIAIVGLINAYNMIDGIDGLAGSLSLVALLWFAVAAATIGLHDQLLLALLVAFCVVGFLVFNLRNRWRNHASVFLGDAGSMMLGAVLAFLAIGLSQHDGEQLSPVAVLWICAVPIIDTASLVIRRLAAGRSPFSSDRQHLHHLMLDAGMTVSEIVAILSLISGITGGIGVLGWYLGVPDSLMLLGLIVPVATHVWFELTGRNHLPRSWHLVGKDKDSFKTPQPLLK
jgi:UDP-GlcNAc:undecaprenyl-phosphate GlcNAc-1-phosphate transferase